MPALAVLAPPAAHAHLVVTGMGPLYDGVSHFALSPEDFLPVIALGFSAGFRGPEQARALSCTAPLAWFAGGVLAMMNVAPGDIALSLATAVLFLVIGGSLAANRSIPIVASAVVAIFLGLSRGMADFAEQAPSGANFTMLFGTSAAIFVVCALAASVTLPLTRHWMIVTARVCGSWIAALGLLLVGWIFRYGPIAH